jgi:Raf kinase inhibitor-like YbhB/YbcL family protein
MAITLTSTAFSEGARIPTHHAGDGDNLSPALAWSGSPDAAVSYTLIMEDPDAPSGSFIHWVLFNIPGDVCALPEGIPVRDEVPGVGRQGMNDARTNGYYGPCPPPGKPHRYIFRLSALSRMLDIPPGCSADQLRRSMLDCMLDSGALMGTYHR